ncbi:MAG: RNA-binding transcriptional accessory protein [Saprospiraceae bacterium]|jgi:uncharacterized protein|nr:RNA-binding transcriptional accessory protein [Saprospiraceae bacterium]
MINNIIATQLNINIKQVESVLDLFEKGCTIPFIARYRKEATQGLDETQIKAIFDENQRLTALVDRKKMILETIESQGALTPELKKKIEETWISSVLEDLYLPFKPKKKTRASIAKEKGLEPLATWIFSQQNGDPYHRARQYLSNEIGTVEEAIAGAKDIIAEWISENPEIRNRCRTIFDKHSVLEAKVAKNKEKDGATYKDYFDFHEKSSKIPSHRLLAIFRGEKEKILSVNIGPDPEHTIYQLGSLCLSRYRNDSSDIVEEALKDSYQRLLGPSIENEIRSQLKEKADIEAIDIFGKNLSQLLLAPILANCNILGIDPGFRTGCKIACIDKNGTFIDNATIFPFFNEGKTTEAIAILKRIIERHKIQAIGVGNGTAGRETVEFLYKNNFNKILNIYLVSEAGASIYSASKVAIEEFPNLDITVRGAISIARRLQDPMAELVKIDPKSIGVGQYQHEVNPTLLKNNLEYTVQQCVNTIGVQLNTASEHLLAHVSGISKNLAQNIIKYRDENGNFKSRDALKNVPRLGSKVFEQAAGFLRVKESLNPLDNTAVHPESYAIIDKMSKSFKILTLDFIKNENLRKSVDLKNFTNDKVGLPTLTDIMAALDKPEVDIRGEAEPIEFDQRVQKMTDLAIGMKLRGTVSNITKFGAFIDIGIKENALLHISQISREFIQDPNEKLKLNQALNVTVIDLDLERSRISVSLIDEGV